MKLHWSILYVVLLLSMPSHKSMAQELNNKLASVYVYNFTKYIEWPQEKKSGSFVIAVYGKSPITDDFNKIIVAKKVGNQPIALKLATSIVGLDQCNLVYIPLSESKNLKLIVDALSGKPILIVSEKPGAAKKGASINLFLDEDDDFKTKFELNKKSIQNNGLIISKQLLQLAERVD